MTNGKEILTYRELYHLVLRVLGSRFETEQLCYHVLRKKAFHLPYCGDQAVPANLQALLLRLVRQRKEGVPLQYLLGEWEFYGLPFKVGRGVLIPRADTETLVDVALRLQKGYKEPVVLDLCSGSGCIAVALEKNIPGAIVTALEVSEQALHYLRRNVTLNRAAVRIEKGDVMRYTHNEKLDLIVSNPPYIPHEVIASLQKEVRYEPHRALDGGRDGLDFYRAIAARYYDQLRGDGWLCFEVGVGQSEQVASIFRAHGYTEIGVQEDLCGVPRVVYGRRPQTDQKGTVNK